MGEVHTTNKLLQNQITTFLKSPGQYIFTYRQTQQNAFVVCSAHVTLSIVYHIRSRGKNIGSLLEKTSFSDFSQFSMNRISSTYRDYSRSQGTTFM